jgi:hypothetical protein
MRSFFFVALTCTFRAASCYRVLLDLNTFTSNELLHVPNIAKDGIYVIHKNSPNVSDSQWAAAIQGGGLPSVTEDNPMEFSECQWAKKVFGGPTYALGYIFNFLLRV